MESPCPALRRDSEGLDRYERLWGGQYYAIKQVLAIVAEEPETLVVVTVYTFYF